MKWLYLEAICFLLLAKLAIRLLPMKRWLYFLGQKGLAVDETRLSEEKLGEVLRIRAALNRSILFLPGKKKRFSCLVQVLAVAWMLRQRKIAFTAYIAVRFHPGIEARKELMAHAWLLSGGETIIQENAVWFNRSELASFAWVAKK